MDPLGLSSILQIAETDFEPRTSALQGQRSSTELQAHYENESV